MSGFGRIGHLVLRAAMEARRKDIVLVAVDDLGSAGANANKDLTEKKGEERNRIRFGESCP